MTKNKDMLLNIKNSLEKTGTTFGEYYGGTIIHNSGPRPEEFFDAVNEGSYTIHVLKVPSKFIRTLVKEEELTEYLTKRR